MFDFTKLMEDPQAAGQLVGAFIGVIGLIIGTIISIITSLLIRYLDNKREEKKDEYAEAREKKNKEFQLKQQVYLTFISELGNAE